MVVLSAVGILLLTAAVCCGTVATAASKPLVGRTVLFGPGFYNTVLMPIALLTMGATGLAPLLNWGGPPTDAQKKMIRLAMLVGGGTCLASYVAGCPHPLLIVVFGLAGFSAACLLSALHVDAERLRRGSYGASLLQTLRTQRRQYTGFVIHVGFFCLSIGVTGSSLGSERRDVEMSPGSTIEWQDYSVALVAIAQRELDDKLIAEAQLEVLHGGNSYKIAPAQHFHFLQKQRTTEVAIHSDWGGDFYTILHGFADDGRASLTLIRVPMMRWLWLGGAIMVCGAAASLWPARRTITAAVPSVAKLTPDGRNRIAPAGKVRFDVASSSPPALLNNSRHAHRVRGARK